MGIKESTYNHHENGTNGLSRAGSRYARFFKVSLDWLSDGRGPMRTARSQGLPIVGEVGAGAQVHAIEEDTAGSALDETEWPDPERVAALRVRGDSQYPRYQAGELILFERDPRSLDRLVNHYAVVDCADGRRLVKLLRTGRRPGVFRLESHNASPEDDVEIRAARLVVGTLSF